MTHLKFSTSALLFTPSGKLILQQRDARAGIPFPRHWATLGGKIEDLETHHEAMYRELVEEIEFVPPIRFWKLIEHDFTFKGEVTHVKNYCFVGVLDTPLEQINLLEGERLGAFTQAEIGDIPVAFTLDVVFKELFSERPVAPHFLPATPEQAELVHSVMQAAFAERAEQQPKALRESVADVREGIRQGGAVLGWWQGRAIASGRYLYDGDGLYIRRVSVLPEFRRLGIGTALMLYMEQFARQQGLRDLHLNVRRSHLPNREFYRQLGFVFLKEEPYPDRDDYSLTLVKHLNMGGA